MKIHGIILAGGNGKRLKPLTNTVPKALLPIGNVPMIHFPIQKLLEIHVESIHIVRQSQYDDVFRAAIDSRHASITYVDHPEKSYGMPWAIRLASQAVPDECSVCVMCADVLFEDSLSAARSQFETNPEHALLVAAKAADTAGYSHVSYSGRSVTHINRKNSSMHISGVIDLGIGFYPPEIFTRMKKLPLRTQEIPLTALHKLYIETSQLDIHVLRGSWVDVGADLSTYQSVQSAYAK